MDPGKTLLKGCRTLASGADAVDILIENGLISKIGDIDAGEARALDAGGLLAMPGLIDCHVHLVLDGSANIVEYAEGCSPEFFRETAVINSAKSLEAGFTHLRDMGCFGFSVAGHKRRFETGITAAAHMLVARGSHVRRIGWPVRSGQDADAAVREQLDGGADLIKAIASGGLLTPGTEPQSSEMPREILAAIGLAAGKQGRPLAVHAYGPQDVENAIKAGARSIEHGYWTTRESLRRAADRGVFLVPTLKALWCILDNSDQLPGHVVRNAEAAHEASERMVRAAVKEGVKVALGTDSGTPFNFHGHNAMEVKYLHELGLPGEDCVAAATARAAELLGLEGIVGSLREGGAADIILISGDPMADPTVLCKQPKAVLKGGRMVRDSMGLH